ncbi:MAG: valine--tRNA ligase [Planctomycetota bacterium]
MTTDTTTQLPPRYEAADVQKEVEQVWEAERCFHAEPDATKEPFCIVIPPPNVTARLHLGHAFNNTIQDILVRHARMQGKNAVWIPGTDHAGIATQTVVEKRLLQTEGKRRTDYDRDEFVAKVQAWKDEYEEVILGQLKAMGCSCDYERTCFTMDEQRSKAVREAFFRLFKDGLIYRGKRLVNWDPATQTALADDEVENEEIDGHFYYLKYPVVKEEGEGQREEGQTITVATTRPETMLGDTAVAINPKDPRAASLRGMKVLLPIVGRKIPIVEDDYVVMPGDEDDPKAKFATGFLKVTPAHDPNDWDIGQRHNLEVINTMAPDASISDSHGWAPETEAAKEFVGLTREEAREKIVAWFEDHGLLEKVVPYRHSVGHSYRSHVPVEPYLSDQWYVAVQEPIPWMENTGFVEGTDVPANSLAGLALTALRGTDFQSVSDADTEHELKVRATGDDVLTFVPKRYSKTYRQWNAALRDWCISRQLWWGHRIPVWSGVLSDDFGGRQNAEELASGPSAPLVRTLAEHRDFLRERGVDFDIEMRPEADDVDTQISFVPRTEAAVSAIDAINDLYRGKSGPMHPISSVWESSQKQDPDVLDTWFSSALWPMSTLGWPERTAALDVWNPTSVLCTAREIITLWVSRMVMFNRYMLAHPDERASDSLANASRHGAEAERRGDDLSRNGSEGSRHGGEGSDNSGNISDNSGGSPGNGGGPSDNGGELSDSGGTVSRNGGEASRYGVSGASDVAATTLSDVEAVASPHGGSSRTGGAVPFSDVFIHAMIQDGHGQKMSKSLGNGVDPLDIIDSHGADAMRFTLAGMATHTQDVRLPVDAVDPHTGETFEAQTFKNAAGYVVAKPIQEHKGNQSVSGYGLATGEATPSDDVPLARNTSSKFDLGRNFCNKLWNASRFVIGNLQDAEAPASDSESGASAPASTGLLQTTDRWILSRLSQTVAACDGALSDYRFDRYTTACYDFFWRDFCDWYVESTKPRTKADDATAKQVLAVCLDWSLRLMHPIVPFATERLWWSLNEAAAERGVGDYACPASERCITAAWPSDVPAADDEAIADVDRLRELVLAVRQLRADHKVEPKRVVPVHLKGITLDDDARQAFETWANAEVVDEQSAASAAASTKVGDVDILVGGIIDEAADAARNEKERAALEKQVEALRGRLANKGYTDKAPPHLVQETRDQLAAAEKQLAEL